MIKFFRHIRKSLLEQNKMGKYFKYAIGEIILVVIGILIALQINNWNENRKLEANEKIILNDIVEDLKLDYVAFEEQNKLLNIQLQIIDFLIVNKESLDSLNLDVDYFRYSVDLFPITFDENIPEELYNKEIIEILKTYYRKQQLVLSDHNDYSIVVKEQLRPYLRKHNIHNPKSALKNLANNDLKLLNFKKLKKLNRDEHFRQILFELKLKSAELNTSLSDLLVSNKQLIPKIENYIND